MLIQSTAVPRDYLNFKKSLPIPDTQPLAFLDIETMGLNRNRDPIILIGIMLIGPDVSILHQYFSEDPSDEKDILRAMAKGLPPESPVLTYNGRAFDIPYINHRLKIHDLAYRITQGRGIDLMYWAKKSLPDAPRHTLKTIEICLDIQREDTLSGAECVQQYHAYLKSKDPRLASEIIRHNYEDILHMAPLLQLYDMLPEHSPLRDLPFYLPISQRYFWIDPPIHKNGYLMIKGSSDTAEHPDAVNYKGSATLLIIRRNLEAILPVVEFAYPAPGSLYIDTDRIPGFTPMSFNALSIEAKKKLLVRTGSRYLANALVTAINRLLEMN